MNIIERAVHAGLGKEAPVTPAGQRRTRLQTQPVPGQPDRPQPVRVAFSELAARGFLQVDPEDGVMLAQFRHLKQSVLQCAFGALAEPGANLVMITSALPSAGKTFLSAHLAQALAMERDRTTLLVDADDTRASLSRALGMHGQPGLFDCFHDAGSSLDHCIHATDLPGLGFMGAGGHFSDATELLTSRRAREVFEDLSGGDRNRLIVLDCPPLLGTPNAGAIARLAGQILVVVEAGVSTSGTLTEALEMLPKDKAIGLVLNKVPRSTALSLMGTHYYYYSHRND